MVYIKKISMKNFKSLSGQVNLNFQPGFNIITGPNGSGKSNILDAVQFVLGELGSKRLRVSELSSLIFDDEPNKSNRNRVSQVTLYFDNSDRGFTIDRNTVSIGRKIDREGKSGYYLNGKKSSRKVLLETLEVAGITPGGYNIVLQGTATRISDLTPVERMSALEDLVGITEYDEKISDARTRLNEAERKIEIASARIDEVKKHVVDLEKQRNDALKYNYLKNEERSLKAQELSINLNQTKEKIITINKENEELNRNLKQIEQELSEIIEKRNILRREIDDFNKEASIKGNTKLPIMKSDLVSKKGELESYNQRKKDLDLKIINSLNSIEEKKEDITNSKNEIQERNTEIKILSMKKEELNREIKEITSKNNSLTEKIANIRNVKDDNQNKLERLTESILPMQESLSGIEIEINKYINSSESYNNKIEDLKTKKKDYIKTYDNLMLKTNEYDELKNNETKRLENLLDTLDEQIKRQKNIRDTIENANVLAKQAEKTVTEFRAKRDLYKNVITEEKALDRIKEMGDAGAIPGYHGIFRDLIKIDLQNQRAVYSSSDGWLYSVIVDDINVIIDLIQSLQKTRLGRTHFIPLNDIGEPKSLPDLNVEGVIGHIPEIIRYEEQYASAVHLIWGDTFLVKDRRAAQKVTSTGYRAVTKRGDVFEPSGRIIGGHYRRPPNFSRLIPSEDTISSLSTTMKTLRNKLENRMAELKLSGKNLKKFTGIMDDTTLQIKRIESEENETWENIERVKSRINMVEENIGRIEKEIENDLNIINTLRDRRDNVIKQISINKDEINKIKNIEFEDVDLLESENNILESEINDKIKVLNDINNNINVQQGFVDRILSLRINEAEDNIINLEKDVENAKLEIISIDEEKRLLIDKIKNEEGMLKKLTREVEATSKVLDRYQNRMRVIENAMDNINKKHSRKERDLQDLILELEKSRLIKNQLVKEINELGYEEELMASISDVNWIKIEIGKIEKELTDLGAVNQLAIDHYAIYTENYKKQSVRINELEKEKQSIIRFIGKIEEEKQEHFMNAYNEICENFSTIFSDLTGGGDGRIELQKPEDPFNGGVDLYVQFPGKPMRLIQGGSGGERSIAAISYLLAIQDFLKAPFYLFDEIDAHLDDLNTGKLAKVLKDNSESAQFLVVSLKDVMVEQADRIYGVYSQEGKSRVIALPMAPGETHQ